jgi:hypothetical protein
MLRLFMYIYNTVASYLLASKFTEQPTAGHIIAQNEQISTSDLHRLYLYHCRNA